MTKTKVYKHILHAVIGQLKVPEMVIEHMARK